MNTNEAQALPLNPVDSDRVRLEMARHHMTIAHALLDQLTSPVASLVAARLDYALSSVPEKQGSALVSTH